MRFFMKLFFFLGTVFLYLAKVMYSWSIKLSYNIMRSNDKLGVVKYMSDEEINKALDTVRNSK